MTEQLKDADLVPLSTHYEMTMGPTVWTSTRVPTKVWGLASAVFGTSSRDDDQRLYRTLQAALYSYEALRSALAAPHPEPVAGAYAPDGVWEALQRMIEDGQTKGPASKEDALTVARHRDRVFLLKAAAPQPEPVAGWQHAGYFYNLVMHALMDVGAAHGGCKYRLQSILQELAPLAAAPQPAEPSAINDECEACAMACEEVATWAGTTWRNAALDCAKWVRARKSRPAEPSPQPVPVVDASDAPEGFVAVAGSRGYPSCSGCHYIQEDDVSPCPKQPNSDLIRCHSANRDDRAEVIFVRAAKEPTC